MVSCGVALRLGIAVSVLLAAGCTANDGGSSSSASSGEVTTSAATRFPDPVFSRFPVAKTRELQAVISGAVSDHAITVAAGARGITAAVVTDHGSWAGAAGTGGDGVQLTPQAMMAIHSITKSFVAAEVMRLAERGKVDLDAPLSTYIRHSLTANGATVRQALSMRSGLTDPPDAALNAMVGRASGTRHWTALEMLAALKPHSSPPGGIPVYSKSNDQNLWMALGEVT